MAAHGVETSLIVFAVSLLVGGFAISVGAKLALASRDYSHAVLTALLGALAWAVVDVAFSRAEIGGAIASLAALLVWAWVVRWRYQVGWIRAAIIGIGAWVAALVALVILAALGLGGLDAYGVPGL
ncbi:hypothetical protein [Halovenus marina]|jgi:hypothetical protein|uniref:hypothetical protein n=1 Tax=Halovenus marina TaxID=3396621 RepID=UPI003F562068